MLYSKIIRGRYRTAPSAQGMVWSPMKSLRRWLNHPLGLRAGSATPKVFSWGGGTTLQPREWSDPPPSLSFFVLSFFFFFSFNFLYFFYLKDKCDTLTSKIGLFWVFQIKYLHVYVMCIIFCPF
jgi:hypothetical protein